MNMWKGSEEAGGRLETGHKGRANSSGSQLNACPLEPERFGWCGREVFFLVVLPECGD